VVKPCISVINRKVISSFVQRKTNWGQYLLAYNYLEVAKEEERFLEVTIHHSSLLIELG
jgi:hypothetical protein